jgi:NAD(P)H-hydrate repair Nnr-like enzyme with NAD(P)H-hydrate epimerase domain
MSDEMIRKTLDDLEQAVKDEPVITDHLRSQIGEAVFVLVEAIYGPGRRRKNRPPFRAAVKAMTNRPSPN